MTTSVTREERRALPWRDGEWRSLVAGAAGSPAELAAVAGLEGAAAGLLSAGAAEAAGNFPVRVPRRFLERMRPADPSDPLLRQVAPHPAELEEREGYSRDPLAERELSPLPGLLHKYEGRALLVVTAACPVHCRYCFRRHFPYGDHTLAGERLEAVLRYLGDDASIREVIWSGGDPLSLSDDSLAELESRLAEIPHLRRLRIHTRFPVVVPQRVDGKLLDWLAASRLRPVVVVHANHPREIGEDVRLALGALRRRGVVVLNQSVLLRGVNDSVDVLCELSEALFAAGALPYYLHLLDPVAGAAHFEVPEGRARELVAAAAARLPGYLVPRLVRETPGAPAKVHVPLRPPSDSG